MAVDRENGTVPFRQLCIAVPVPIFMAISHFECLVDNVVNNSRRLTAAGGENPHFEAHSGGCYPPAIATLTSGIKLFPPKGGAAKAEKTLEIRPGSTKMEIRKPADQLPYHAETGCILPHAANESEDTAHVAPRVNDGKEGIMDK